LSGNAVVYHEQNSSEMGE